MIKLEHLYKSFPDKDVLYDINTTFEDGKTNLIIGQSGSGKTVLMKCIVGLFEPTKGDVIYDSRSFISLSKRERTLLRREMGMIFQSAALFDSMSVLENVMFPLDMFSDDKPFLLEVRVIEEEMVMPMVPPGKGIDQIMLNRNEWYENGK